MKKTWNFATSLGRQIKKVSYCVLLPWRSCIYVMDGKVETWPSCQEFMQRCKYFFKTEKGVPEKNDGYKSSGSRFVWLGREVFGSLSMWCGGGWCILFGMEKKKNRWITTPEGHLLLSHCDAPFFLSFFRKTSPRLRRLHAIYFLEGAEKSKCTNSHIQLSRFDKRENTSHPLRVQWRVYYSRKCRWKNVKEKEN